LTPLESPHAHAERNARLLLCRFPAHRDAQLIKEKLLENQSLVRLRAKRIQRFKQIRPRRKMDELDCFAREGNLCRPSSSPATDQEAFPKILKCCVDDPAHHA